MCQALTSLDVIHVHLSSVAAQWTQLRVPYYNPVQVPLQVVMYSDEKKLAASKLSGKARGIYCPLLSARLCPSPFVYVRILLEGEIQELA